jgi:hypothetical protein
VPYIKDSAKGFVVILLINLYLDGRFILFYSFAAQDTIESVT